ncbi:glycoside hydrolase, partial [Oryctes borbonicus]
GILRGLETFAQSIYTYDNDANLYLNATNITDYPRFPHRGLLLDTARHYLSVDIIYKHLDAMSYSKINVFHWHIVDDQSFPYQSNLFPELSEKGAYHSRYQIYSPEDVRAIIGYARLRGIRVIVEFDTPGHTRSWGQGVPELLSSCYKNNKLTNRFGPMDPSRDFVFSFLNDFFGEIKSTFPDKHMHLGGDEVPFDCWENNPDINAFMARMNISGNYQALQRYFMERLMNITSSKEIVSIVWEEVFNAGTTMPNDAIVQVWYSQYHKLDEITLTGRRVLYSTCWYLDHLSNGGDWKKYYFCDPQNFNGNEEQLKLILGGEACMWAEVIDNQNVLQRTWPRAAAAAEKLWSAYNADNIDYATRRMEEHACRLNRRGIPAQPPNGPGYCLL